MIPKIIHYCWFGGKEKSKTIQKYINSWKTILPDYEIVEWNEHNFPVDSYIYSKQAYELKKYAFVSDVARLYALYNYGGIYLDTDIEILKPIDSLLNYNLVASWESNSLLMTAFMAASKGNEIVFDFLNMYSTLSYIEDNGELNQTANTVRFTSLLKSQGLLINRRQQILNGNICIKETEEIGAFDADSMSFQISDRTLLVHHCNASWFDPKDRLIHRLKICLSKVIGKEYYNKIKQMTNRDSKNR